jgi:hypothetical protein
MHKANGVRIPKRAFDKMTLTLNQIHNVNRAIGDQWFNDTRSTFNSNEYWGRVLIYATGGSKEFTSAAIVVAHSIGDKACREFDMSSSLEDCNRSAKHYQEICRKALEE